MSFHLILRRRFPGSVSEREYVSLVDAELLRAGLTPETTLIAVGRCRDELTGSLPAAFEKRWGRVFELAGLAGMVSAGLTGLEAALSHAPPSAGRARLVVVAMTHVGIDDDGRIGVITRPGFDRPTAACGSLQRLLDGSGRRRQRVTEARLDVEQANVEARLGTPSAETTVDLADLARQALACVEADLTTIIGQLAVRNRSALDYGLFTGVQIHGPAGRNLIWPSIARLSVDGRSIEALPDTIRMMTAIEREPERARPPAPGPAARGRSAGPGEAARGRPPAGPGRPAPHRRGRRTHRARDRYEPEHTDLGRYEPTHYATDRFEPEHQDLGRYEPEHTDLGRYDPTGGARRRRRSTRADREARRPSRTGGAASAADAGRSNPSHPIVRAPTPDGSSLDGILRFVRRFLPPDS